jgi:hypothetical protein
MAYPNNPGVIMGAPSAMAGYNPLGTGNAQMDAMFAQFAMPMLSQMMGGQFIPQQFPAQNVMDQMVASKYMQASRMAELSARQRGTDLMFQQFQGIRRQSTNTPLSPMGARQLNNLAGTVNSEFGMMMAEMVLGPQNTEDFFFGRRGDPVQLQRAINQIGFYRPDAVTGADQMSGETLQQFSNQIYSNLYGPDADLNDISGLSAGRVGTMMSDLARRGLLPQSMSKMGAGQRAKELTDASVQKVIANFATDDFSFGPNPEDKRKLTADESQKLQTALKENAPLAEIEKLTGGSEAIRKIDATRVSNSLKGYSEAVKAVRQIFGDNGMSNAPMGQLIAAMEALTQNSMSSMSPGKIENLMRRTQMASRDSGVSLEALMGLSARSGALAQQYGLAPELAAHGVVNAMEHGRALRDTGGLTPGFGRMDADKAVLFATDANLRGTGSLVGRYMGALARAAAENKLKPDSNTAKMLAAVRRGETTYFDGNKTVNIAEELGRNADAFIHSHVTGMGMSLSHFNALVSDPNTQEFLVGLEGQLVMARQGAEYKQRIGDAFKGSGGIRDRAFEKGMSKEQAMALEATVARGYGNAVVDDVNTATMTADERIDALYSSMRSSFIDYAKSQGKEGQAAIDEADRLMFGKDGLFSSQQDARAFLSEEYARTGNFVQGKFGVTTSQIQQGYNSRTMTEAAIRAAKNNTRAGLNINIGDGSNFLQRFSDALAGKPDGKTFLEAVLGSVDSVELNNQLMEGLTDKKEVIAADFDAMAAEYSAATIDNDDERAALAAKALSGEAGFKEFADLAEASGAGQFAGKKLVTTNTLKTRINEFAAKGNGDALAHLYVAKVGGDIVNAKKIFSNPSSKEAQKAIAELAASEGLDKTSAATELGLIQGGEATETDVLAFINNQNARIYANRGVDKKRIAAIGLLGQQLGEGRVSGNALLGRYGIEDKEKGEQLDAFLNGTTGDGVLDEIFKGSPDAENQKIMARFSRNVNALGGFDQMGAAGYADRVRGASRLAALEKNSALLKGDTELATALKAKQAGEELSAEQKKVLREATAGSDAEFEARINAEADINKGDKTKTAKQISTDAAAEARATAGAAGAETGGILGQLTSGLASAMSDVFKDVKIENVTITNFKLPEGFGKELASGAVSAVGAMLTGGAASGQVAEVVSGTKEGLKAVAQSMNLTGTVTLNGVDKLIMQLRGDTDTTDVPNGPPVAAA